jgi:hypothetical protein
MIILYTFHAFGDIWPNHYNRPGTFIFPDFSSRINPFVYISNLVEVKRNLGETYCQLRLVLSMGVELNIFSHPMLGARNPSHIPILCNL